MHNEKILIVDDMVLNRELLKILLEDKYEICEAVDGKDAIAQIEQHREQLAVVLLDIIMPNVDGYEVLKYMKEHGFLTRIPVLMISSDTASGTELNCLEMGASDFIKKPFERETVRARVENIIEVYKMRNNLEDIVGEQTKVLREQNRILQEQKIALQETNERITNILGTIVEYRNLESGEHIQRVKGFTKIIAEKAKELYPEFGLTEKNIETIVSASALHDIGKISVKDSVLLKPGRLTQEEFEHMKTHTTSGAELVSQIHDIWDEEYEKACYDICRSHHERYDGRGYPDGLVGDEIPLSAQLVSIADVYDALINERCYKKAFDMDTAYHMILNGECGTFSPKLLECFRAAKEDFEDFVRS